MRILLAEDDPRVANAIADSLAEWGHEVILAEDGEAAVRALRTALPAVLLLDLVLPRLDGLAVLSVLPSLKLERKPYVIAMSPFRNDGIARRALDLGASHILPKPLELKRLKAALSDGMQGHPIDMTGYQHIESLLKEAGIPLHTKGGQYLAEAIAIVLRDYSAIEELRRRVYQPIADKNATRVENVERLIRHAIETACIHGRIDALHRLFGQTVRRETGKPTNSEFIAILAENVRLGLQADTK